MAWREFAPAKINLTLHVTGRRTDGYHLLDSLVVFVDQGDWVSAVSGTDRAVSLTLDGPEATGLSAGPDNLVLRAARAAGLIGHSLRLEKNLPLASGIGGGSADAAAVLRLAARLGGHPVPEQARQLTLGADVPVCVLGAPCRMRGVGEDLDLLPPLPEFAMLLVNPRIEVATPAVFAALTRRDNPPMPKALPDWRDTAAFLDWLGKMRNDLEPPARILVPAIDAVLGAIAALPGCALARMSGSGATCFGLFTHRASAEAAAASLAASRPDWWVKPASCLSAPVSAQG